MIPVYGFLQGDTIGLLLFAYERETAADLIRKLQNSAAIRVKPRLAMDLLYKNQIIEKKSTVLEMGLQPLDHFFVIRKERINAEKSTEL